MTRMVKTLFDCCSICVASEVESFQKYDQDTLNQEPAFEIFLVMASMVMIVLRESKGRNSVSLMADVTMAALSWSKSEVSVSATVSVIVLVLAYTLVMRWGNDDGKGETLKWKSWRVVETYLKSKKVLPSRLPLELWVYRKLLSHYNEDCGIANHGIPFLRD